jgi:hypothetical protein
MGIAKICSHEDRYEDGRLQLLEKDVCQWLTHGVRDKEDGQCCVELGRSKTEVGREASDLGVADVGSVEKGEEVEDAQLLEVSALVGVVSLAQQTYPWEKLEI